MRELFKLYLDSYRGLSTSAWMLALVMLINRTGAMVIPFLGVYLVNFLDFSLQDTGTVLSCFGVGAVCGNFIGGWITDKAGYFKVQLISLLLTVPMFLLLPQLKSVLGLGIGIFFLSLISESFRPANSVAVASYSSSDTVVRSFSLNRMAINLGFSIGPALGGLLAAISYPFLFYGNAFAALCSALIFFFYFRGQKGVVKRVESPLDDKSAVVDRSPYRDGPFLVFSLLCCLFALCFLQLLNTIPLYYRTVYKMSEIEIGMILAFSGLVVFSLEMLMVHIVERKFTARAAIVTGTLLCAFSFLLLNIAHGIPLLYFSIFILCLAEILALPFSSTVTLQRSSYKRRGAYMGVNALCYSAGHAISPFLGTRLAAAYGFDNLWWATTIVLTLTAIGFYLVMRVLGSD